MRADQPVPAVDGETLAASPLDAVILDNLRQLGERRGQDVLGTIVQMYLDQTPTLLATLRDAVAHQDAEGVRRVAHTLKSNCGHVGALALVELCQELEDRCAAPPITDAATRLRAIEMEYASVRDALHELMQEVSP